MSKCTEKADVYLFAMICIKLLTGKVLFENGCISFELLTGKPFEDKHLQGQGDTTSRNIRAGEHPLFLFQPPNYLVALTKRCWHADPEQCPRSRPFVACSDTSSASCT